MTLFDLLVIAVLALSIGFAIVRGALREIGTLLVLGLAAGAAYLLAPPVQGLLGLGDSIMITAAIAGGVALVGFVLFYILLHLGLRRVPMSEAAVKADRIAGGVFGFARGLVLIGLGFLAYGYYLDESRRPESVNAALTLPVAKSMANFFEGFAPEQPALTPAGREVREPASNAAVEGYARGDRSALSEIVTTVTTDSEAGRQDEQETSDDPIADVITRESEPE